MLHSVFSALVGTDSWSAKSRLSYTSMYRSMIDGGGLVSYRAGRHLSLVHSVSACLFQLQAFLLRHAALAYFFASFSC